MELTIRAPGLPTLWKNGELRGHMLYIDGSSVVPNEVSKRKRGTSDDEEVRKAVFAALGRVAFQADVIVVRWDDRLIIAKDRTGNFDQGGLF